MKKIVITGPESTGKSTLVLQLANYFNVDYVDEFAREYLSGIARTYTELDLVKIAQGQINLELEAEKKAHGRDPINSKYLFYDTDLLTLQIWSDYKYGRCDLWILDQLHNRNKDLYLLCKPDLDWKYDPLRENPNDLEELYNIYKSLLEELNMPFILIEGDGAKRFEFAVNEIEQLFKNE